MEIIFFGKLGNYGHFKTKNPLYISKSYFSNWKNPKIKKKKNTSKVFAMEHFYFQLDDFFKWQIKLCKDSNLKIQEKNKNKIKPLTQL